MQDNPSIDAGGVRRDFYSRVYEKLASGSSVTQTQQSAWPMSQYCCLFLNSWGSQ